MTLFVSLQLFLLLHFAIEFHAVCMLVCMARAFGRPLRGRPQAVLRWGCIGVGSPMKQCWHCFAREPNVSSDKRSTSGTHLPRLIPLHIGKSNYAMLAKTSPDPIGTDPGAQVLSRLIRRKFRSFDMKSLADSQSHCQNASLHGKGLRPAPSGPASCRFPVKFHRG